MAQDEHAQNHWKGNFSGSDGALWTGFNRYLAGIIGGNFIAAHVVFLSTCYSALGTAHGVRKLFLAAATLKLFLLMLLVPARLLSPDEADVVSRVALKLRFYRAALRRAKHAARHECATHTTRALATCTLMETYEALGDEDRMIFEYHHALEYLKGKFSPEIQKVRVLRSIAVFEGEHFPGRAQGLFEQAEYLAQELGALDQVAKIRKERVHAAR